jgi:hypothetical protein
VGAVFSVENPESPPRGDCRRGPSVTLPAGDRTRRNLPMADEVLVQLTADIVAAHVSNSIVAMRDVGSLGRFVRRWGSWLP